MSTMKYTDIGHSNPNDAIWILFEDELIVMPAGQSRTHELIWGGEIDIEDHWRGRRDYVTAFCSIAPPQNKLGLRRPPKALLTALRDRFSIARFYYFTDGVDSFSPSLKDKNKSQVRRLRR